MRFLVSSGIFIYAVLACQANEQADREPWSLSQGAPVLTEYTQQRSEQQPPTLAAAPSLPIFYCLAFLRLYQKTFSRLNKSSCPMEPSCSVYSMQAIRKNGAVLGITMTGDRLIHEISAVGSRPTIMTDRGIKYFDPVDYNDYWWRKEGTHASR